MNGKKLLIGLSYIDRKYIEESEQDMRFTSFQFVPHPNSTKFSLPGHTFLKNNTVSHIMAHPLGKYKDGKRNLPPV